MTDTEFGDVAIPGWSREIAEALVRDVLALRIKYGLPLTLEGDQ